jgi:hypothetical protein
VLQPLPQLPCPLLLSLPRLFAAAAFAAAAFAAGALAADELLAAARFSAARLSAANADVFSLGVGDVVGIAAEIAGADGAAVTAECDVQATVTMRVSTHRIAPVIARNTSRRPPGDFDLLRGVSRHRRGLSSYG